MLGSLRGPTPWCLDEEEVIPHTGAAHDTPINTGQHVLQRAAMMGKALKYAASTGGGPTITEVSFTIRRSSEVHAREWQSKKHIFGSVTRSLRRSQLNHKDVVQYACFHPTTYHTSPFPSWLLVPADTPALLRPLRNANTCQKHECGLMTLPSQSATTHSSKSRCTRCTSSRSRGMRAAWAWSTVIHDNVRPRPFSPLPLPWIGWSDADDCMQFT